MAHVITSPCRNEKAAECTEVCPVDAIQPGDDQYYINPDLCIDCAACVPVCPVNAIFFDEDVPEEERDYIKKNELFFAV